MVENNSIAFKKTYQKISYKENSLTICNIYNCVNLCYLKIGLLYVLSLLRVTYQFTAQSKKNLDESIR